MYGGRGGRNNSGRGRGSRRSRRRCKHQGEPVSETPKQETQVTDKVETRKKTKKAADQKTINADFLASQQETWVIEIANTTVEESHLTKRVKRPRSEITRGLIKVSTMETTTDPSGQVKNIRKVQQITACLDSASSISIAPLKFLHCVTDLTTATVTTHVTGSTKFTQKGLLVIPQLAGNTIIECYVGEQNRMPTHTDVQQFRINLFDECRCQIPGFSKKNLQDLGG